MNEANKELHKLNSNKELLNLFKQWEQDFKGDLKEAIEQDLDNDYTLKECLEVLINEHFPIWIVEAGNEDLRKLYIDYKKKFKIIKECI